MIRGAVWDNLRRLSPAWMRSWIKNQKWFLPVSSRVFGNTVYSKSYYDDMERLEGESVEHIADWIVEHMRPKRAIDIGCGSGLLMNALQKRGVEMFGVDLSPEAVGMARAKGLDAETFDLTDPKQELPGRDFDLAISCEVAEHLEEKYADMFVDRMTGLAPKLFLTAAEPDPTLGQGLYHFNEQPNAYWIEKVEQKGFVYERSATEAAREHLRANDVISYLTKPMVFMRESE